MTRTDYFDDDVGVCIVLKENWVGWGSNVAAVVHAPERCSNCDPGERRFENGELAALANWAHDARKTGAATIRTL